MVFLRLLGLEDILDGLQVFVHWKGLETDEGTLEPLAQVAKDVPQLFEKLLKRRSAPRDLVAKARAELAPSERRV